MSRDCCHPDADRFCAACALPVTVTMNVLGAPLCGACYSTYAMHVERARRDVFRRVMDEGALTHLVRVRDARAAARGVPASAEPLAASARPLPLAP